MYFPYYIIPTKISEKARIEAHGKIIKNNKKEKNA